jgi:hypothetical protein
VLILFLGIRFSKLIAYSVRTVNIDCVRVCVSSALVTGRDVGDGWVSQQVLLAHVSDSA